MNLPGQRMRLALLGTALTALFVTSASAAILGAGTVNADALRLRSTPTTEGAILATATKGTTVTVLESVDTDWYKVMYDTTEGYMSGEYLDLLTVATMDLGYGEVTADGAGLNLRDTASSTGGLLTTISDGTVLQLDGIADGWFLVSYGGHTGYVSSDYITLTDAPDASASANTSGGQAIVDFAKTLMGKPYVYGSTGPNSFDCSGFTTYVYKHFGYTLNRTAAAQVTYDGTAVSKDQLSAGDLVFFRYNSSKAASHVGIYIGNGDFIHASTNAYKIQVNNLSSGHYANVYVGARRILS